MPRKQASAYLVPLFLPGEVHAKVSALEGNGRDYRVRAPYGTNFTAFLSNFAQNGSSGKMSPAYCRPVPLTKLRENDDGGLISQLCWRDLPESFQKFLETVGETAASPMENSITLRTEFLTLNGGESHSAAVACSLLDVLQKAELVPQKYYLSSRAARGILNRAAYRGRRLPEILEQALLETIAAGRQSQLPELIPHQRRTLDFLMKPARRRTAAAGKSQKTRSKG